MILISHRGNISGRKPELENSPGYILEVLRQGYMVEVDVRWSEVGLFFGHEPGKFSYPVDEVQLMTFEPYAKDILFHCKNIEAFRKFQGSDWNFFFHDREDYALSSKEWIISHSKLGNSYYFDDDTKGTVLMLPEIHGLSKDAVKDCAGVCSDIISFYK